ncbi:hypothetical protein EGW08_021147 [Elysia chlorotica]|uniref:3'-5' exonuclease domain-containing protein n=1 Tax=Elysia chlorotica TaxID=188477 RepID=A0A3S0ZBF5_ELYCH|nr:hypothetical protein EGW08_021147 [Elysia chlorotica]
MNGQAFGDIAEEKPSTFTLSAAMEAYKREEGSMQIKPTEELGMLQQERLTDAVDFIPSANSNNDDNFEDFYETQNYTLICRISEKFYESIKSIMYHHVVGVAFEGQNLGRTGVLSLVQVATGSEIIVFDMVRLGDEAFKAGLQCLFESEDVIHDCRWVADLLRFQYDITMANIFDTQVANAFVHRIFNEGKWPKHVQSLPDCLTSYLNLQRHEVHSPHISEENEIGWLERPLPPELLDLATKNAVHLLRLHRVLLEEMLSEFKAAVEIYLNLTSGGVEDLKKHQGHSPSYFKQTKILNIFSSRGATPPRPTFSSTKVLEISPAYDNMGIAVVESSNEKTDTGYETIERMAILSPCCSSRLEKEQIKLVHLNQQEDESSSANSTSKKYLDHQEQSIPNVMKYPLLPTHDHSQKEDISQAKAVHPGLASAYTKNSQPFSQNSKTIPGSDGILSLRSSTPAEMQETCRRKMIEESQCSTSKKLWGK